MDELFRAFRIEFHSEKGYDLQYLSMNVRRGEVLGIIGNRYAGIHSIISMIKMEQAPLSGCIFWDGELKTWDEYYQIADKSILSIGIDSCFVSDLSIWENVMILWKCRKRFGKYNKNSICQAIRDKLKEFDQEYDLEKKISQISPIDRMMLELMIQSGKSTRLILLDIRAIQWNQRELLKLQKLLDFLKKKGMSFVLFGHQLEGLLSLADRIGLVYRGRLIKYFDVKEMSKKETEDMEEGIAKLFWKNRTDIPNKEKVRKEAVLEIKNIRLKNEKTYHLTLYKGCLTVIMSLYEEIFDTIRQITKTCQSAEYEKVLFVDMKYLDSVIEELSPMENICMGWHQKIAKIGFIKKEVEDYIVRDFTKWYGSDELLRRKNSEDLYCRERVAINLYRMKMFQAKAIICTDFYLYNDLSVSGMVRDCMGELLKQGTAVCMIAAETEFLNDFSDEQEFWM